MFRRKKKTEVTDLVPIKITEEPPEDNLLDCPLCFDKYEEYELIKCDVCNFKVCNLCIKTWYRKGYILDEYGYRIYNKSCPQCRTIRSFRVRKSKCFPF